MSLWTLPSHRHSPGCLIQGVIKSGPFETLAARSHFSPYLILDHLSIQYIHLYTLVTLVVLVRTPARTPSCSFTLKNRCKMSQTARGLPLYQASDSLPAIPQVALETVHAQFLPWRTQEWCHQGFYSAFTSERVTPVGYSSTNFRDPK